MTGSISNSSICRRQAEREAVTLVGSAYAFARSNSVIIADLSPHGAQLVAQDLPPAGEDMFMVAGSADMFGRVMWRSGDHCGLCFDEPLSDDDIAKLKTDAKWESVAGWLH
jgi:hypothetical protein